LILFFDRLRVNGEYDVMMSTCDRFQIFIIILVKVEFLFGGKINTSCKKRKKNQLRLEFALYGTIISCQLKKGVGGGAH